MQIIRLNNKLKELVWRRKCVHLAVKMATEICAPVRFSKRMRASKENHANTLH